MKSKAKLESTIEDFVDEITVGYVGPMIKEYKKDGIPFLRSLNVQKYRIDYNNIKYISKAFHEKIKKSSLHPGDVVIVRTGNPGTSAVMPEDLPVANCSDLVIIHPGKKTDPHYLVYYLNSSIGRNNIRGQLVGSVQSHFNIGDAKKLIFPYRPLNEQKSISKILFSFDQKIESIQKQNKLLEKIAQTIFKSWFIDFDGQKEFVDSELGEIPKGWHVSTVGSELQSVLGGTPSRKISKYWKDGSVSWINSSKTREFRVLTPSELITDEAVRKSATKLLPRRTTIIAITGATVGQIGLLEIESCANQSVVGIPQTKEFPAEFIYFWMKFMVENILLSQTGGAQQHINKNNIDETLIIIPTPEVMSDFVELARPFFEKIAKNCFEIINLKKIRDEFLPKLIFGAIRV